METKICRICGKLSENYVHIFKTEGLKNKIETCLPIIVSPHCLLPDTICCQCSENVDNFYSFIKNCLQNIIILEAQYDIHESCLKTKRKHEKSCMTDLSVLRFDKNVQTEEDFADIIFLKKKNDSFTQKLAEVERILSNNDIDFEKFSPFSSTDKNIKLVDYEVESNHSDDNDAGVNDGNVQVAFSGRNRNFVYNPECYMDNQLCNYNNSNYFADAENNLINEITSRKNLKRKNEEVLYSHRTKMFKMDTSNRRKSRQPKKVETSFENSFLQNYNWSFNNKETSNTYQRPYEDAKKLNNSFVSEGIVHNLPQACLLCDAQLDNPSLLAKHVYDTHGIDMAQVLSSEPVMEKKKKLPNLLKIADLKCRPERDTQGDVNSMDNSQSDEQPPTLQPSIVCPLCPSVYTNRPDLFHHLRSKHAKESTYLCGLCLNMLTSYASLTNHVEKCRKNYAISGRYVCKICAYNDDSNRAVENHVKAHDFILTFCKQQSKIYDPNDYVDFNPLSEAAQQKTYQCTECGSNDFETFKDFSEHRRNKHQIFHCDLCNKFYGRNSHLWKHVNRLHKGDPSITCQLCYKTSASKYHLAQHFNKLHTTKPSKSNKTDDFLSQKFEGFDFQSVRQSFMRQELLEQAKNELASDYDNNNSDYDDSEKNSSNNNDNAGSRGANLPKEIDASSNLYTNIITNYSPPQEGEFKCPKCHKGFVMKSLLKKHKKNCRPRMQKDLLTRCKSCSRIFKDRQSLAKHLTNYHSEYACEICKEKVQSKCEIVSHIRFSHPNCHLFCHCGDILRNTDDLIAHQNDHCNSFVCQFCGDTLETKIKLKMHILSLHRKILSLSCGICLKLFETQHILRDHVRLVHKSHLKPFVSCTVCGKNYGSKWKTYDHLNKSHGRIFRACKVCLEVFDTDDELERHYGTKHSRTANNNKGIDSSYSSSVSIKKETYESDFEDEKHFLSDLSNDYEHEPNESCDFGDGSKMSLLEKRLLSSAVKSESSTPDKSNKSEADGGNSKAKANKSKRMEIKIEKMCEEEKEYMQRAENQALMQSGSKRTVYVNSNDPSLCEICKKTWPAKKHLWQHYIRCHKSVAATVCGICLKTNDNYETLQNHLRETHPTLLHGQGFGSNFICRICGRYHNARSKLKLHMAIHENFNLSLLEKSPDNVKSNEDDDDDDDDDEEEEEEDKSNVEPTTNGFYSNSLPNNGDDEEDEDINYENLIEQVECSSGSELNDTDSEAAKVEEEEAQAAEEERKIQVVSSDNDTENESNFSDLESEMLKNMILEKNGFCDKEEKNEKESFAVKSEVKIESDEDEEEEEADEEVEEEDVVEDEVDDYSTSGSDESSNNSTFSDFSAQLIKTSDDDDEEDEDVVMGLVEDEAAEMDEDVRNESRHSNTNDSTADDNNVSPYGERLEKSEELDSAIRSISYSTIEQTDDDPAENDYGGDVANSQSLNQHELQSAVDSIL